MCSSERREKVHAASNRSTLVAAILLIVSFRVQVKQSWKLASLSTIHLSSAIRFRFHLHLLSLGFLHLFLQRFASPGSSEPAASRWFRFVRTAGAAFAAAVRGRSENQNISLFVTHWTIIFLLLVLYQIAISKRLIFYISITLLTFSFRESYPGRTVITLNVKDDVTAVLNIIAFFPVIYSNKVPLIYMQEVNVKSCATIERLLKILRHSYLDFGVVDSEAACVPDVSRCEGPTWALLLFNAAKRSWFDLETNQTIFFVILFEQYIRCPNWWKISKFLSRQKPSANSNLLIDAPAIEIPRYSIVTRSKF